MKHYYTFGIEPQYPSRRGWENVYAQSLPLAIQAFQIGFSNNHDKIINCANYDTEAQFEDAGIMQGGNRGSFCHQENYEPFPKQIIPDAQELVRVDVLRGIYLLGYHRISDERVSIRWISGSNYFVAIDGYRFGIWDAQKRKFID